jgi:DNA-binding transcriptional LysR family regulator
MDRLSDLRLFVGVVDAGGLAAGGRRLGLSPASVTERIAALEARTGARLLVRTTRSIALTDEGRMFLDTARSVLAEIDDLEARLRDGVERVSGRVRLTAPVDLGRNRIAPLVDRFIAEHPQVSVELILGDGFGDLIGDGIDFAVRFGALADSGMIARKIGSNRRLVCASPSYVERHGRPSTPTDLADHQCLVMLFGLNRDDRWRFSRDGREMTVTVRGSRAANDGDLIRRWALEGRGVALKSIWDVGADLEAGRLVELVPDYTRESGALSIVYPPGRQVPRRSRALMEAIENDLRGQLDDDRLELSRRG